MYLLHEQNFSFDGTNNDGLKSIKFSGEELGTLKYMKKKKLSSIEVQLMRLFSSFRNFIS